MSTDHLEPARSIIAKIGVATVAEVTGKHVSRVYRWMYPKSRGGTGGFIPQDEAQKLLGHAHRSGIDLNPADFFLVSDAARPEPELPAALDPNDVDRVATAGPDGRTFASGPALSQSIEEAA